MDVLSRLQAALGGSYVLGPELGGGGMSRVFLAEDTTLRRKVVVKMLPPDLVAGVNVERFKREILVAAQLQHPHIVPILAAGEMDGVPYFTMPFVEGESLRTQLAHGPLRMPEVLTILRDVARALAFAHDRGVVHRDIKPDNVLLSAGSAAVTDFGIAKAITDARTPVAGGALTQGGISVGTPAYMAPEQAAGDPATDHRADIYAFGCLAYELLAGHPPFVEKSPHQLVAAHMTDAPRPVREIRPDTPVALAELVMHCLAKDPDARPQQASDLVIALDDVTSGGSRDAVPTLLVGGRAMLRKALAIYGASFVAVAIIARAAIVAIGLPDWVFPGTLVVMALGLPIILLTGYAHRMAWRTVSTTPVFTRGGTWISTPSRMEALALKASPMLSWRRAAFGGLYALGGFILFVIGFMTLRALGVGPAGSLLATGRLAQRELLLLTDFRVSNADSALGSVVSDAVRAGLAQSRVISLVPPPALVAALRRMHRPPTARLTLPVAREIAQREGIKAVVDGEVTGVAGGYVVAVRLLSADSAIELASFRETGEGPRGLIDAADKAARALRGKIGESLRSVQASPPLSRVTTTSLDALRKYSEGWRANVLEADAVKAVSLLREAVALDTAFASAWRAMAAAMGNAAMPRAARDSAVERAYTLRERLPEAERLGVEAFYYFDGPQRDRQKAIALFERALARGDSTAPATNLGEALRSRRNFARAESLNLIGTRYHGGATLSFMNTIELQMAQGRFNDAERMLDSARTLFGQTLGARVHGFMLHYNRAQFDSAKLVVDSLRATGQQSMVAAATELEAALSIVQGRLSAGRQLAHELWSSGGRGGAGPSALRDSLELLFVDAWYSGPSREIVTRLDRLLDLSPLRTLPPADRPYFDVASIYAFAGRPDKGRQILAQYRAEVTDTVLRRLQSAQSHLPMAEIALVEGRPVTALEEFRAADTEYDGYPADECGACVAFRLGRAFDAMSQRDSAITMYELFLALPYYLRHAPRIDGIARARTHKRLGELYESRGDLQRALSHYAAFLALWRNADPELQPQVADVRRRVQGMGRLER